MKITIKQLQHLIREAIYQGPDTKTTLNVPYSTRTASRDVQVKYIDYLLRPQKRSGGWIYIDLLESGNSKIDAGQLRDLFSSLGFDRAAIKDMDFSHAKFEGLGHVLVIKVGSVFHKTWTSLFGHETEIHL